MIRNDLVNSAQQKREALGTASTASPRTLRLIAAYKLFKGLFLFVAGLAALKLLRMNLPFDVERWADICQTH